jgi:hypothetical protein
MVGAHARNRREQDGGQRRRDRDLDDGVGRKLPGVENHCQERHHDHPPADAQQAGEKAGEGSEHQQQKDGRQVHREGRCGSGPRPGPAQGH